MALIPRLLEGARRRRVWALVRGRDEAEAAWRLRGALAEVGAEQELDAGRVVALPGDLERPGLGLEPRRRDELAERVTDIVHSAASVSFTLPLARARAINVEGTRRVLDLAELCAERGGLRLVSHVSTAYVAGTHSGAFGEDDLDLGQGFHNSYERSKWEAERLVRARFDRLPIQVLRPSIVVGDERTGWTASFNVIYTPLRAFARGALPLVPARRSAPVDVVSVSYVADAIVALADGRGGPRRTYHLTAGAEASTVGELLDLSARRLRRRRPLAVPPGVYRRCLHPLLLRHSGDRRRRWLERSEIFFPYFRSGVRFDASTARRALDPAGIRPSPVSGYFDRLLDYALEADWGARSPRYAAAGAVAVAA
jgi:long-chain acyl-CoA synthetase